MVDSVKDLMEGCPPENVNLLYLILSGLLGLFLFVFVMGIIRIQKGRKKEEFEKSKRASMLDSEFQNLQIELYGEKALRRLKHMASSRVTFERLQL
jgi:hypothetical protein